MKFNNRVYDFVKFVALVLLPGISAAYFGLAQMWDLPNAEKVVGTATVIDTLLGLVLKASTNQYTKTVESTENVVDGDLIVMQDEEGKYLAMGNHNVDELAQKDAVRLKVINRMQPGQNPPA